MHMHDHHDFVHDDESTSHIESVWAELKWLLSLAYAAVKADNYINFLKKYDYRKKIVNLNNSEKIADV